MVGRSARACGEAFADFIEQLDWGHVSYFDVSSLPGETAHLVYQLMPEIASRPGMANFNWVTSRHGGATVSARRIVMVASY